MFKVDAIDASFFPPPGGAKISFSIKIEVTRFVHQKKNYELRGLYPKATICSRIFSYIFLFYILTYFLNILTYSHIFSHIFTEFDSAWGCGWGSWSNSLRASQISEWGLGVENCSLSDLSGQSSAPGKSVVERAEAPALGPRKFRNVGGSREKTWNMSKIL